VATSDRASAKAAAAAALFAQHMLIKADKDLAGCPADAALRAVLQQTASVYAHAGRSWASGSADAIQVNAALAMLANVSAQATRAGFALHEQPLPAGTLPA
jgi:hypothetical protein